MSDIEILLVAFLIPFVYVLTYIAGKYDILTVVCKILQEWLAEHADLKQGYAQVVRCKDCEYRHSSEFCECRPEDGFCNDGERRRT